jgi:hypothetical protein
MSIWSSGRITQWKMLSWETKGVIQKHGQTVQELMDRIP